MGSRFAVPVALLGVVLVGCPSPTKKSLKRAAKALEECDVRTANVEFDDAYTRSPDDLDAALGFALTEVMMLPEDKDLNRALGTLGFTRDLDAEDLVYGNGGFIDQLTAGDCDLEDLESELPYPPLWDEGDFVESLSGDPTIGDLLVDVSKMSPRFKRIGTAFETAADEMEEPYLIELSGSCGGDFGEMAIQTPELYAMASAFTVLRASIATAEGYDWGLPLRDLYEGESATLVDLYNAHLLHVVDHAAIDDSAAIWLDAIDLADAALAAADAIDDDVDDQLFDWSELDSGFVADLRQIGDAGHQSIAQDQMQRVPFWTPELQADVGSIFTDPVDAGPLNPALFRRDGRYVEVRENQLEALFVDRFDRDLFNSNRDEYWDLDHWDDLDLEDVLDPDGGRWSDTFECD